MDKHFEDAWENAQLYFINGGRPNEAERHILLSGFLYGATFMCGYLMGKDVPNELDGLAAIESFAAENGMPKWWNDDPEEN